LAVGDVHVIEVRRFDWLKTAGAAVLTAGVTLGVGCALLCSYGEFGVSSP
jgi:hypothetical protein